MIEHTPDVAVTATTLIDLLQSRARLQPHTPAFTFLRDGETAEAQLTYAELDRQARAIGALLQDQGAAGARVVLLYPPGLGYIAAFFGCLYGGAVAVPAYPPRLNRPMPRLQSIAADANATIALSAASILDDLPRRFSHAPELERLRWFATDDIPASAAGGWRTPALTGDTLAMLQYTSGSTAAPKGVMLNHRTILHNLAAIRRSFGHTAASQGVIWLPPYHDMGLIGGILQPLYSGFPVTLMPPVAFLERPLRWLQAITRYRATTSGGPNFAFDLCVEKITPEQRATLDLSNWQVAFAGAEPIRSETLARFTQAFAPCGFRTEALYPCYGLAEATLLVSSGAKESPPVTRPFQRTALEHTRVAAADGDDARVLVGCGHTLPDQTIVIADPNAATRCAADQVGEIWVAGPSVAQGYWNQPEETRRTFQATLAGSDAGPFLRTGDLGFLKDGELFVTGRIKDLIIIRGRNHYPQDIEQTVEASHPALRPGSGAAFSVEVHGAEQLVVVQEVQPRYRKTLDSDAVARAIRQAVTAEHDVQVYAVVFLKAGSIPKTSSGKIQRHACRGGFLDGSLDVIGSSVLTQAGAKAAPLAGDEPFVLQALAATPDLDTRRALVARYLHEQAAQVMRIAASSLDSRQPLSSLGIDSLAAIELKNSVETSLGVALPLTALLAGASLADLAGDVLARLDAHQARAAITPLDATIAEHPLSKGQEAIWFLYRLAPDSAAYNIARAVRIRSELDVDALGRAFQALVDRHAALRTTFATTQSGPVQRIHQRQDVSFQHIAAAGWSVADVQAQLVAEAQRPFDLERGPVLRIQVFSMSAHDHVLLLAAHHIAADLWSMAALVREVGLLYAAEQAGRPAALPALALQYSDYARWQAEMLGGPEGARLAAYWRQTLAGELPILNLASDRPRPPVQRYRGAAYTFQLSQERAEQLKALAAAEGITLYALLLATYQVLLFRYTGQQELIVGSPTSGRSQAELAGLVGYFVNPVALRASLSPAQTFRSLLEQVRHRVLAALAHQAFPFSLLVEQLQPQRDASYSPIFQTAFVWQQTPRHSDHDLAALALGDAGVSLDVGGLRVEALALPTQVAQFDLTLTVAEVERRLAASLEYNSDLFDATTAARMAEHWQRLIAGIVADPDASIARLPLLDEPAGREVIASGGAWHNAPARAQAACLHACFEAQAAQTPDATALVYDGPTTNDQRPTTNDHPPTPNSQSPIPNPQHLTYTELNRRANQLADHLRGLGVGPEVRVGICVERSLEMVIGLLGVLKAGGAYVPLDPAYPRERLAFMLADSGATVLLTQQAIYDGRWTIYDLAGNTAEVAHPMVICLDSDWEQIAGRSANNPIGAVDAANLAYVIYTSGSTGQPKGVAVTHQNVVRLFGATQRWLQFDERDTWTLFHSYAFDFSVWELWGALLHGGRLLVVPYWVSRSPQAFYAMLQSERVTVLNQTPAAFHQLMRVDAASDAPLGLALRLVIFGGEALELQRLQPWFERHGDRRPQLVNMYGITETTVHVTYRPLSALDAADAAGSVIGAPLPDMQLHILDPLSLQPVPIGVAGELYIGGAGLGRGYLNRPDLTAERFVPNPCAADTETRRHGDTETGGTETRDDSHHSAFCILHSAFGTRLYRTGDLARRLADGDIEYLGRIDDQVKIRGFRIELGEIAAALRVHPAIRDVVVVVREPAHDDGADHEQIVAHAEPVEPALRLGALRRFLKGGGRAAGELAADKQLVAYVVSDEPAPSVTALRLFLKQRLPDYMTPAAFVMLDALPLTPNGKLDRRALPPPDQARPDFDEPFVAPRTPVEQALAAAWKHALGVEQIGIDDNYFALGGDSIRSLQVQSRALESGLRFSLPQLFQFQTIRELAQVVEQAHPHAPTPLAAPFSMITEADRLKLPGGIEDAYPLSRIQAGVIFHSQLRPDSPMYRDIFFYQLRAPLDLEHFQTAVQRLVDRHAIFRTAFYLGGLSEPLQLVHRQVVAPLHMDDLRSLSAEEQAAWQAQWIAAEKARPFSWTDPPLIHFFIQRLTNESFHFVISFHDAILDGWSTASMLVEILHGYAALLEGKPYPAQPPPAIAYREYVALERHTIASHECQEYWDEKLRDYVIMRLPRAQTAPPQAAPQIGVLDIMVAPDVSAGLHTLARLARVPLKHVLLAAHLRVMRLLGGQPDVLTGLESNGRLEEADGEQTIGIHLNAVPFRQQLPGGTWVELAQQTFATERELWPFRRFPYAEIQRRTGGQPLFETAFNYTHFHVFKRLRALKSIEVAGAQGFGQTHFTLKAEFNQDPFSDRVQLDLECNLSELSRDDVAAIGTYYANTLAAMARTPFGRYEQHSPLSEHERHELLVAWNNTAAEYAHDRCIHDLFAGQAGQTPDAVALVFDRDTEAGIEKHTQSSVLSPQSSVLSPEQLTYAELNRRANQLAHHLRAHGVGVGSLVSLCVERSLEMSIGLLAILKAGAAYVPLDPSYPRERLAAMLADVADTPFQQAHILLTQARLLNRLPDQPAGVCVLCLDSDWAQIAPERDQNPVSAATTDSPAYVIFTSGSTGRPKGAIGTHRGAINRFCWMWATYPFAGGEVCCQKTSLSFVDAVWEVFGPLLRGVPAVIIRDEVVRDPHRLVRALAEQRVTRLVLVPALLRVLLAAEIELRDQLPLLTCWVVSGEALARDLAERFRERLPGARLINLYGASEVSADVTCYDTSVPTALPSIPIGRPIANTQIYILDAHLEPVPVGVPGELHVGGAGLALGYLNRPELTAERFVPNPFGEGLGVGGWGLDVGRPEDTEAEDETPTQSSVLSPQSSARLYRTGDLARYLPDGTIEFLGRRDQQEKIRGHRIELGEIEAALNRHPAIRESAVVARGSGAEKRLVAYVVGDDEHTPPAKPIDVSLFYFAADEAASQQDKYRLYLETAKFADQHGFSAVWTPERHFHEVGGLYPNPAPLSAALAMVTQRIQLRAGSVVLPLQHPIRVAEEWAIVDNLSNGRAGISFVSGWVPNDFAFFPEHFADKRAVMLRGIEEVRKLWRGEAITARDGVGNAVPLHVFPRPIQPELPIWLTCNRDPQLFEKAGELGVNVLTALLNQTLDEAAANIQRYRDSLARHGHDPDAGRVTMMLHTFVADTEQAVLEQARGPFCNYMLSHVGLIETWLKSLNISVDVDRKQGLEDLAAFAFERYYQTASLIGTPSSCRRMLDRLLDIGVDEVGCLIDFGIAFEPVMQSLRQLSTLREQSSATAVLSGRALRRFLKETLPDTMLPADFVVVETLPRTPNGKLNRHALPEPAMRQPEPQAVFAPPQTPSEQALAEIWRDVLQLERVSVDDNFFEIGGHSLKATQLMSQVRQRFGIDLPVQQVFTSPTIKNMAAVVDEAILAQASAARLAQLLDLLEGMDEAEAQQELRS